VLFEECPNAEFGVDIGLDQALVRGVDVNQLSASNCNHVAVAVVNHADKLSDLDLPRMVKWDTIACDSDVKCVENSKGLLGIHGPKKCFPSSKKSSSRIIARGRPFPAKLATKSGKSFITW
jgi:hypothetical protein